MKNVAEKEQHTTVVVADAALAEGLRPAVSSRIVEVDHYLDALGEMAHQRVDALVGRMEPMQASVDSTVRALRELAPEARLLLVIDAEQEPQAMRAVRLGMDDYVVRPLGPEMVAAALMGEKIASPVLEEEDERLDPTGTPEVQLGAIETGTGLEMMSASEMHGAGAEAGVAGFGSDVDLVDQMLRDRKATREAAVAMIRQRSGVEDVTFSETPAEKSNCVPVRFGGVALGYLNSAEAGGEELAPHAAWLARWLMLERQMTQLHELALKDQLTGVWNRRYFDRFLDSILQRAKVERFRVTVMVFDIDDFKSYNDRFGHAAGDEILKEAARLMQSVVRKHDVVARIGGDEFGVIFWDAEPKRREHSEHPMSVRTAAARFQKAICEHRFPKLGEQAPGTLTISGGLASYPWDGNTPGQLVQLADECLLQSKGAGKNAITFGPGAMRVCGLHHKNGEGQTAG